MRRTSHGKARDRVWARASVIFAVCGIGAIAGACSEPTAPASNGNDVVDDTRPEPRPPANPDEGTDGGGDAAIYPGEGGATLVLNACDTCACSPDQYYCFGGATARAMPMPLATADASADASGTCEIPDAGGRADPGLTPAIGCNALPTGCTDCPCILQKLQPTYACYLVCANDGKQLLVYCPHP